MGLSIHKPLLTSRSNRIFAGFTHRNAQIRTSAHISGLHFNGALPEEKQNVHRHYAMVAAENGFDVNRLAWVNQVHGDTVWYASRGGALGDGDALYTDIPGVTLSVRVADCAAVLLVDHDAGIVAAAHAGWRGARLNIVSKTISLMQQKGGEPARMKAYVSPCISKSAFEVGEEVAVEFPEKYVLREDGKKPHVDLKAFLLDQLQNCGLQRDAIEVDGRCTVGDATDLYSYRREGKVSGRMIGFIGLR
jgi:YfiH family protein